MEELSSEIFNALKYLLPGFLTAWIFHAFTATPKPSQFERVVQALIFTVIIQGMVIAIKPALIYFGSTYSFGPWNEAAKTMWLYISATILGFVFSIFTNNDKLHRLLRWLKITKQSSYHCEWYGAFHDREKCYVILNLLDGRRICGWPYEWPSDPTKGHFLLTFPAWVDGTEYKQLTELDAIMFKVSDIQWVEFIKPED